MTAGERSKRWMERARRVIPGGVNSPVRAFGPVGGDPPFVRSGRGCRIEDEDGRSYVDFVGSWGPLVLGHAHPEVMEAAARALRDGSSFGAATAVEVRFAELLCERVPGLELVRLVSSGTEATMSALRLARGATGRERFVKFDGCYHGHADSYLVAAGSGVATLGIPGSPGVPSALAELTTVLPFNDLAAAQELFASAGDSIAAVIVEPVAGNMGCVPPEPGFLEGLQQLCKDSGALFIMDEVMTGFRVGPRCAVGLYDLEPDLICLGKVIGGGFPLAAFGGKRAWMEKMAPVGPVYQAGTLSGNPVAVAAGEANLQVLGREGSWARLESLSATWFDGLAAAASGAGVEAVVQRVGSMGCLYLGRSSVRDFSEAKAADAEGFVRFHGAMLERGVYLAPSPFEAAFVSLAHTEADLEEALGAARESLAEVG
jgi:glutamate-1-semialdehyde 2,1-aminomutase